VPVERFTENLTWFVTKLQEARCRVILMTFGPLAWTDKLRQMYGRAPYVAGEVEGFNAGREPYVQAIRQVAGRTGAALVDIDKAYREHGRTGDLLLDGMHPNSAGHRLTAELLLRELHRAH
jgi:lysophospholipase L1-like esterase